MTQCGTAAQLGHQWPQRQLTLHDALDATLAIICVTSL